MFRIIGSGTLESRSMYIIESGMHKLSLCTLIFILFSGFGVNIGCLSNRVSLRIYDKYFIEYNRNVIYSSPSAQIQTLTNFPSRISVVVSRGIFGVEKIFDMGCIETEKKGIYRCSAEIPEDILKRNEGKGEIYFWFIVKTDKGYYSVPNLYLLKDKLFDYLGRIEKKEGKEKR